MTTSLEDLLGALLKLKILSCQSCSRLIESPIMLVKDFGSVCVSCFHDLESSNDNIIGLENTPLQTLVSKTDFPCLYEKEGCCQKVAYKNLHDHELQCNYRPKPCMFINPQCNVVCRLKDFVHHFIESHEDAILTEADDVFNFVISAQKSDIIAMLKTSCGAFLLRIKFLEDTAACLVYDTGEISKSLGYAFIVEFAENKHGKLYSNCNVVDDLTMLIDFDEVRATKIRMRPFGKVSPSSFALKIVFHIHGINIEMNKSILKLLECPICKHYMTSPILQCKSGHSLCSSCKSKISQCSFCRSYFEATRNYALEELSAKILCPCPFEELGCTTLSPSIENHQMVCNYRLWSCPSSECSEKCIYLKLLEHVRDKHVDANGRKKSDKNKHCMVQMPISSTNIKAQYFIKYDLIFEVKYTHASGTSTWEVTVFGPMMKGDKYAFQVGIYKGDIITTTFTGSCKYHTCSDKIMITFADHHLNQFVDDVASFNYYITFTKVN